MEQISHLNTTGTFGDSTSPSKRAKKAAVVSGTAGNPWIIIVPAGTAALLTMYNVKEFLVDERY